MSATTGTADVTDARSEDHEDEDDEEDDEDDEEDRKPAARGSSDEPPKKKRRRRRVISTLQESKWQQMYQRLYRYKEKFGNVLVPNRYAEDTSLGAWVATQRRNYRVFMSASDEPSGMTGERVRSLEAIGFQWTTTDPRHEPWEVRYEELQAFVQKYGHAEIPMRWEENVQLSNWVSKQRQDYKLRLKGKSSRLTDERMQLLDALNFKWHIPRKGRKIKQKSIPVIKNSAEEDDSNSDDNSPRPRPSRTGGDPPALTGLATGTTTVRAESAFFPMQQVAHPGAPSASVKPAAESNRFQQQRENPVTPSVPSSTSAANGNGNSDPEAAAALPQGFPAAPSAGGIDPNNAVGLQNALAALSSGNPGMAALAGQPAAFNFGGQALLSSALGLPQAQQQNPQSPTTLLLPIQFGNVLSAAQQQNVVPMWPPDPATALGLQGMLFGFPGYGGAVAAQQPSTNAASIMSQAFASQLLGALTGAPQVQPQPQHSQHHLFANALSATSTTASAQQQQQLLANALSATNPSGSASSQLQLQSHQQQTQQQLLANALSAGSHVAPLQQQQQVGGTANPNQHLVTSLATLIAGHLENRNPGIPPPAQQPNSPPQNQPREPPEQPPPESPSDQGV